MSQEKLESLQKLPVRELKEMCRSANMKVSGTKYQLLMRLCGMEKPRMSIKAVNKWLEEQGVTNIENVSKCLKAGIQERYVDIEGDNPLDNVIAVGECSLCLHKMKATIRDILYQLDYSGFDYQNGGVNAPLKCPNKDCQIGNYVANICCGGSHMDCGKGHNHCTVCPGFGMCIGDFRERHCRGCRDHYFAGSQEQFKCSTCYGPPSDEE